LKISVMLSAAIFLLMLRHAELKILALSALPFGKFT
jgi:hypothetical protein